MLNGLVFRSVNTAHNLPTGRLRGLCSSFAAHGPEAREVIRTDGRLELHHICSQRGYATQGASAATTTQAQPEQPPQQTDTSTPLRIKPTLPPQQPTQGPHPSHPPTHPHAGLSSRSPSHPHPPHPPPHPHQPPPHPHPPPHPPSVGPVPIADPVTEEQLEWLVGEITAAKNVLAITGAGISTESGIPDYRGPQGAYTKHGFKPMTHQQFMAGPAQRARYFARSFFGWHTFASAQPSDAHTGLARLVRAGWVSGVVTQNVDRLHHKAGTPPQAVLELHGTTHEVQCQGCGAITPREHLQATLAALNPAVAREEARLRAGGGPAMYDGGSGSSGAKHNTSTSTGTGASSAAGSAGAMAGQREREREGEGEGEGEGGKGSEQDSEEPHHPPSSPNQATSPMAVPVMRPDGDVEVQDAGRGFVVPPCPACGGILKPHVVYFGDSIPKARTDRSLLLARTADLVLVVGSSLTVYSAYRLVDAALKGGARVVVLNVGATRADKVATAKLAVRAGEVIMRLASHPRLLVPRA